LAGSGSTPGFESPNPKNGKIAPLGLRPLKAGVVAAFEVGVGDAKFDPSRLYLGCVFVEAHTPANNSRERRV
jgi:hypothetical protein